MIKITLKDGSIKEVENGSSVLDVAKANNNREIANRQKQSQSNNSNK